MASICHWMSEVDWIFLEKHHLHSLGGLLFFARSPTDQALTLVLASDVWQLGYSARGPRFHALCIVCEIFNGCKANHGGNSYTYSCFFWVLNGSSAPKKGDFLCPDWKFHGFSNREWPAEAARGLSPELTGDVRGDPLHDLRIPCCALWHHGHWSLGFLGESVSSLGFKLQPLYPLDWWTSQWSIWSCYFQGNHSAGYQVLTFVSVRLYQFCWQTFSCCWYRLLFAGNMCQIPIFAVKIPFLNLNDDGQWWFLESVTMPESSYFSLFLDHF